MLNTDINIKKPHIPASFNMYLVISTCVTAISFKLLWPLSP
jgi:hypothetical protein